MTAQHDPGLQPERTVLAWRRTLLALAVGALVSMRVLAPLLGNAAVVVGLGGLAVVAVLWILAGRRHAHVDAVFRHRAPEAAPAPAPAMPGGALLLALTLLVAAAAALGLLLALRLHL